MPPTDDTRGGPVQWFVSELAKALDVETTKLRVEAEQMRGEFKVACYAAALAVEAVARALRSVAS